MSKFRDVGGPRDLIDVTPLAHELGFSISAMVEMELWQAAVELGGGPTLELARLWDVLRAAKGALERSASAESACFQLMVVKRGRARFIGMQARNVEGVLTITMGKNNDSENPNSHK